MFTPSTFAAVYLNSGEFIPFNWLFEVSTMPLFGMHQITALGVPENLSLLWCISLPVSRLLLKPNHPRKNNRKLLNAMGIRTSSF